MVEHKKDTFGIMIEYHNWLKMLNIQEGVKMVVSLDIGCT